MVNAVREINALTTIMKMIVRERNRVPVLKIGRGVGKREMENIDGRKVALVKGGCDHFIAETQS